MDSGKLDRLARLLASAPSRRSVVRALAATAIGAGVVARAEPAVAACREVGDRRGCKKNSDCCDNTRCRNKKCKCKSGYDECDGKCVDLDSDEKNCGRCDRTCKNNETCVKDGNRDARCRKESNRCSSLGRQCNDRPCCAGLACKAGNDAFKACVLA